MRVRNLNMLKKGDLFIVLIVIIMIAVSFVGVSIFRGREDDGHKTALIIRDGRIRRIDLDAVDDHRDYG